MRLCKKCGQVHERCSGHRKNTNPPVPCMRWPRKGEKACRQCGGNTPRSRAAGERARRDAAAARAVANLTRLRDVDPVTALLEEVQRAAGAVAYIEGRIHELDPDGLVWGRTQSRSGYTATGSIDVTTEGPGLNEWIRWWHIERDKLVKASAAAIAADVDTRIVQLAELQGAMLADVIAGVLDDLHLTDEQLERVPTVVPRRLRLVSVELRA